ncbi:MAG: ABC transporter ATP-binding protein [Sulfolobales archaeon]
MQSEFLSIEVVFKRFGGIQALRGISLKVSRGEIIGLIGPNGSGKTTLINIITGIYRPDNGRILFLGEDLTRLPQHEICRRGIARTFQIPRLFVGMSVKENMLIASEFCKGTSDEDMVNDVLKKLGLWDKRDEDPEKLTLIEKRLLELGRAIASSPKLLLVDEVAAGLRTGEIKKIGSMLQELNSNGITVVWVEHNVRELIRYVRRLVVLNNGQVIADGDPETVISNPLVVESYLGKINP